MPRLAPLLLLLLLSCKEQVDCDRFQHRVQECQEEFHDRLNPKIPYDSKKLHALLKKRLYRSCKNRGGEVGDASKINGCLAQEGCPKFVSCILGREGVDRGTP